MAKVALYVRVSTTGQTVENQGLELEAWARRAGHEVVVVYADKGISGAKGRDRRPEFDEMLKDAVRRRFDLLAAWSVDRLGRSLPDLVNALKDLHEAGLATHQFSHAAHNGGGARSRCRQAWRRRMPRLNREVRPRRRLRGCRSGTFFRRAWRRGPCPTYRWRPPRTAPAP